MVSPACICTTNPRACKQSIAVARLKEESSGAVAGAVTGAGAVFGTSRGLRAHAAARAVPMTVTMAETKRDEKVLLGAG
jgi:hypothetical protein